MPKCTNQRSENSLKALFFRPCERGTHQLRPRIFIVPFSNSIMAREAQQCQLMQQPCLALFFVFYLAFCVQEVKASGAADVSFVLGDALRSDTCHLLQPSPCPHKSQALAIPPPTPLHMHTHPLLCRIVPPPPLCIGLVRPTTRG